MVALTNAPHTELSASTWGESEFPQDMKHSENDVYWSYDPELCTVVMRRLSSYENIKPVNRTPAAEAEPSTPIHSSADVTAIDSSFSEDSTLIDPTQSPGKTKSPSHDVSHCDILHDLDNDETSLDDADVSPNNPPVLHGLGISGLVNNDGTPFDGTGIVGLARSVSMRRSSGFGRCGFLRDPFVRDDRVINDSETTISRTLINELADAFTSSPSPRPRLHRHARYHHNNQSFTARPESRPGLYRHSPYGTDYLYSMHFANIFGGNAAEFDYASQSQVDDVSSTQPSPVRGLGIFGLARSDGQAFDGTGIVGVRGHRSLDPTEGTALNRQGVTQTLIEEAAHTFSASQIAFVAS